VIASWVHDGDRRNRACWIGWDRRLLSHGISLPDGWLCSSGSARNTFGTPFADLAR